MSEVGLDILLNLYFQKVSLKKKVIHVDRAIGDVGFWELMYDNDVGIGIPHVDKESYIIQNIYTKLDLHNLHSDTFKKVQSIVEPYGIIGFEYDGGSRLGGGYTHRAFCIWDEEFVNNHIVEQVK